MSVSNELPPVVESDALPEAVETPRARKLRQMTDAKDLIGRRLNQRYELERLVGAGGTAWVFKARDLRKVELNSSTPYVAVKILKTDLQASPEAWVGLEREAARAQKLAHPNIVGVHGFDREGDLFYMVMEWLSGLPLDEYIARIKPRKRLQRDQRKLICGLLSGLQYAHQQGVIHADLKPSNVMLDEQGNPRLLDFGVARLAVHGDVVTSEANGFNGLTPSYASANRHRGMTATAADDRFALACVIYEILTGKHPYQRRTVVEARQLGILPTRPGVLSRKAWKILAAALEVPGVQNQVSLKDLMGLFESRPPKLQRPRVSLLVVTVLALTLVWVTQQGRIRAQIYLSLDDLSGLSFLIRDEAEKQRQSLWQWVRPDLMGRLNQAFADFHNSRSTADLMIASEMANRIHEWKVQDSEFADRFVQIEAERVARVYLNYRTLQNIRDDFLWQSEEGRRQLTDAVIELAKLSPGHPVLSQGRWVALLHARIEEALHSARWSEALSLCQLAKQLGLIDTVLEGIEQRLLSISSKELVHQSWPGLDPVNPAMASERMIAELIAVGNLEGAQIELASWIDSSSPVEISEKLRSLVNSLGEIESYQTSEGTRPALRFLGQQLLHLAGAQQSLDSSFRTQALDLFDRVERGAPYEQILRDVEQKLADASLDVDRNVAALKWLQVEVERKLKLLGGASDATRMRYQDVMQRLGITVDEPFANANWSCQDQLIAAQGSLVSLCRDWLAPNLPGPELVLVSDLESGKTFYLGKGEIQVSEFNLYCRLAQGCQQRIGSGDSPVSDVSITEAVGFTRWLSKVTGETYRLPSDQEWSLVAASSSNGLCHEDGLALERSDQGLQDAGGFVHLAGNLREYVTDRRQLYARGGDVEDDLHRCDLTRKTLSSGRGDRSTGFRVLREVSAQG